MGPLARRSIMILFKNTQSTVLYILEFWIGKGACMLMQLLVQSFETGGW